MKKLQKILEVLDMNKSKLIQAKICNFFELKQGFAFPSKHFSKDGDLLVIKIKNIKSSGLDLSKKEFVSIEYSQTHKEFVPADEDLLISLSGNRYEGSIETWAGKVSYYSGSPFCIINQRVGILRKRKNINIDTRYFYYLLSTIEEQKKLILIATSSGGQANLSKEQILTHKVNIHSFSEQKAIAHILGTLDKKIILNKKINENLDEIAKALFKSWFIDFDPVIAKAEGRSTGLPDEISDLFPNSFEDSDLGKIPAGWEITPIINLCQSIKSGGTPSRRNKSFWDKGNIKWFKTGEMKDCLLLESEEFITEDGLENSSCKYFDIGDILFAMYGATVGKIGILTSQATSNQAAACLRPIAHIGTPFLACTLYASRKRLMNIATGAAQQNLYLGVVKKHKVLSPTQPLPKIFTDIITPLYQRQFVSMKNIVILKNLRNILLPQLISGELRITDAEKIIEDLVK